jgi:hypothetical protein
MKWHVLFVPTLLLLRLFKSKCFHQRFPSNTLNLHSSLGVRVQVSYAQQKYRTHKIKGCLCVVDWKESVKVKLSLCLIS